MVYFVRVAATVAAHLKFTVKGASELYEQVAGHQPATYDRSFPVNPSVLSKQLRHLKPAMEVAGIFTIFPNRKHVSVAATPPSVGRRHYAGLGRVYGNRRTANRARC
jgi:hypothetical protein